MALATTTLSAACTAEATTIRVTSATGFRPQQLIQIDGELLMQNSAGSSGTTISVRRAVEGTLPAAHAVRATVATGTGADFAAPPPGAGGTTPAGTPLLRQQTTRIPHAQILTLPSTSVELVAAPGANRVLMPVAAHGLLDTTGGAYTAAIDASWLLQRGSRWAGSPTRVNQILATVGVTFVPLHLGGVLIWTGQEAAWNHQVYGEDFAMAVSDLVNRALAISDAYGGVSDYTGGQAANTLTVSVAYYLYDTVLKAYV